MWSTIGLFILLVGLDTQNAFARFGRWLRLTADVDTDFTFVVPLFGDPKYFRNSEFLSEYINWTVLAIAIDSPRMAMFADECEAAGWRVHRARLTGRISCPEVVHDALASVRTDYVIRIDGDTKTPFHPGLAVAAARRARADLCSVRVLVNQYGKVVEKLQGIEYEMSMLGRRNRPWMTSGAAMIARTDALRLVLGSHSMWFPGEDLETGVIANHYRLRVRHIDFPFYTDAPDSWRALFRQRRMWWSGSFRMAFVNADQTVRYPITFAYTAGVVWLLLLGKWSELATVRHLAHVFPFIILMYTAISVAANWEVRSRWMILFPYYAIFQSLVVPVFGAAYYLKLWRQTGKLKPPGRYRIGFCREDPPAWAIAGRIA
jgi:hypothetical protein